MARPVEGAGRVSLLATRVALGGHAQDYGRKTLGDRYMVVLRYRLDCGSLLELIVPVGELRDGHLLGPLRVWCHSCNHTHGASVRMVAPGPVGTGDTGV